MNQLDDLKQLCEEMAGLSTEFGNAWFPIKHNILRGLQDDITQDDCDALCASVGRRFTLEAMFVDGKFAGFRIEIFTMEWVKVEPTLLYYHETEKLPASIFATIHILREAIKQERSKR
jgi:hypothetical protein